ncbi:eCIS core domain-containing protein [Nakamurella lactea]|uniref:eCIS core domain-containing protein n=1 Tax=Nakamurella lactea TaxID=459515 RepID=UPI00041CC636|nr:DUF4157 domain-containing protein [Nakamurella lactea]
MAATPTGQRPVAPVQDGWAAAPGGTSRQSAIDPVIRRADAESDPLGGGPAPSGVAEALRRRRGAGEPLSPTIAAGFGAALSSDLSAVRIHADGEADSLTRAVQATAFAHGADIYFRAGAYAPQADRGQRLLAHELSHVVQARGGPAGAASVTVGRADDPAEAEADRSADRVMKQLRRSAMAGSANVAADRPERPAHPAGLLIRRGKGDKGDQTGTGKTGKEGESGKDGGTNKDGEKAEGSTSTVESKPVPEMTSVEYERHLATGSTLSQDGVYLVDLSRLPSGMQAFIGRVQGLLTELEATLATDRTLPTEQRLRDKIKTGARSWHQDSGGKVPDTSAVAGDNLRVPFFERFLANADKPLPNKQAKKNVKGIDRPLREYTAMGWKEAEQNGRLIYDPIGDVFYLTCRHYLDEHFFRIIAPRPGVPVLGGTVPAMNVDELTLLLFKAWEDIAAELADMNEMLDASVQPADPTGAKLAAAQATQSKLGADARSCVRELFLARAAYRDAVARAKARRADLLVKKAAADKLAVKMAAKLHKEPKLADEVPERVWEEFRWHGGIFVVDTLDQYIGYYDRTGAERTDPYPADTTIGQLAGLFRTCIASDDVVADAGTAIMLAGLVAEPNRHPTAALEALFAVTQFSPFRSSTSAFKGSALPMTTGGTIGSGGVPTEVMYHEAGTALAVVTKLIGTTLPKLAESTAGKTPEQTLQALKRIIYLALADQETRDKAKAARQKANASKKKTSKPGSDSGSGPVGEATDAPSEPKIDPTQPPSGEALPSQSIVNPVMSVKSTKSRPTGTSESDVSDTPGLLDQSEKSGGKNTQSGKFGGSASRSKSSADGEWEDWSHLKKDPSSAPSNPYPASGIEKFAGQVLALDYLRDWVKQIVEALKDKNGDHALAAQHREMLLSHLSWQIAELEPDPGNRSDFVKDGKPRMDYNGNRDAFESWLLLIELVDLPRPERV